MKHLEGSASSSLWFVSKRVLVIKQSQGLCHRFHHHWPSSERPSHRVQLYPPMLAVLQTKTGGGGNTTVRQLVSDPRPRLGSKWKGFFLCLFPSTSHGDGMQARRPLPPAPAARRTLGSRQRARGPRRLESAH